MPDTPWQIEISDRKTGYRWRLGTDEDPPRQLLPVSALGLRQFRELRADVAVIALRVLAGKLTDGPVDVAFVEGFKTFEHQRVFRWIIHDSDNRQLWTGFISGLFKVASGVDLFRRQTGFNSPVPEVGSFLWWDDVCGESEFSIPVPGTPCVVKPCGNEHFRVSYNGMDLFLAVGLSKEEASAINRVPSQDGFKSTENLRIIRINELNHYISL